MSINSEEGLGIRTRLEENTVKRTTVFVWFWPQMSWNEAIENANFQKHFWGGDAPRLLHAVSCCWSLPPPLQKFLDPPMHMFTSFASVTFWF